MIRREAEWSEVFVGGYLEGGDGQPYLVVDGRDGWLLLQAQDGRQLPVQPWAPKVVLLEPDHNEAVAAVTERLGATRLAEIGPGGIRCDPLDVRDLLAIHTHFFMLHGVWTRSGADSKSPSKLLENHRLDHEVAPPAGGPAYVPHHHNLKR